MKIDVAGINIVPVDPRLANTGPVATDTADSDCARATTAGNSVSHGSVNPEHADTDLAKINSNVIISVDTSPADHGSVDNEPNFPIEELVALRLAPKMNTVTTPNSSSRRRRITLQSLTG